MTCKIWPSITLVALLALFFVGSSGLPVMAIVFNGENGSMDYNDPLNWENDTIPGTNPVGVPPEDFDAIIGQVGVGADTVAYQNPAVVTLAATPPVANSPRDLRIGQGPGGDGTLDHSAGTLATGSTNWTFIGNEGTAAEPSIGRYNLSGTAVFDGTGAIIMGAEGGPHPDPNMRNQGYLTVADSALLNTNALAVGRNAGGYGQVDQTGGTVDIADWGAVGEIDGSEGLYNMSGGTLNAFRGDGFSVGQNMAKGTFNVSGNATVDVSNFRLGRDAGGSGLLTITGENATIIIDTLSVGGNDGVFTGGQGTLRFTSESDVSPIQVLTNVYLNDGSVLAGDFDEDGDIDGHDFLLWQRNPGIGSLTDWQTPNYGMVSGFSKLEVDLETSPPPAGDVLLIDNQSSFDVNGTFNGLAEGALVPNSGGRTISYIFGDGNDIGLVAPGVLSASLFVPEPSSALLVLMGVFCLNRTRLQSR